jgi:hypothetical protein
MNVDRAAKQSEIDSNLVFFQEKLPELLASHAGKYVLLRHREIVGIYDTALDAQVTGQKFYADGLFSVQRITDEPIDLGFFSHAVHLGQAQ